MDQIVYQSKVSALQAEREEGVPFGAEGAASMPVVQRYIGIALRWKWLILGSVVAALLLGIVLTLLMTPQYTATTQLEISREGSRIVNVGDTEPERGSVDLEFYQTQYGLLGSEALADRVAKELRLVDDRAFLTLFGRDDLAGVEGAEFNSREERDKRLRATRQILLDNVSVDPIRLSRLVDLSFTSPDSALSARVANAWAEAYIRFNLERRFEATAYARDFLEERLEQLRGRLEQSERDLVGYASNQAIINLPAGRTAEGETQERSLTADSLTALNEALAEATAARVQAESRLSRGGSEATPEALANPTLNSLRARRAEVAAEYARLLTQFEPGYPAAQALKSQLDSIDRALATESGRVGASLRRNYNDALERERRLQARVEELKDQFLDQRRRSIQYNIYQRDVDTNRELYEGLLQRYKEIGVAGGVGSNNIAVVDRAVPPQKPSSPRPLVNVALSLLIGLLVGSALAILREQLDETIRDPNDVQQKLGVPLIGAAPDTKSGRPLDELNDVKSGLSEAYLAIQGVLAFASDHGVPRTLAVTSTRAAEGKSTSAFAIANTIARNGVSVVLVDCDMRSPSVAEFVGLPNTTGLSTYLSGDDDLDRLLARKEGHRLTYLPAGPQPPNAADLLRGERFGQLLRELLRRFDQVIIDSPPVMGLADAPIIAREAEGVVFVVEAGKLKSRVIQRAIARLVQVRAPIVGAILTKFDARQAAFGYGYDYGYGYGYGETYGSKRDGAVEAG
jgi:polysaccharide biosynthesis transport protein